MKIRGYKGFALPTILIVSVILMSVLVVASVSVAGVRSTMAAQYYNQIAKNASEAGVAYAKACVKVNGGVAQWSDAKPLRPFTDCSGTTILNTSDPNYYVSVNGNAKATFSVGYPSVDSVGNYTVFKANGSVDLVRTSNGVTWRTYSQNTTSSTTYVDDGLPLGTSLSGYWSTAPEGYLFEDGSAVSRTTYADLFELIGTTFGSGDGSTTFNLPDSRGRVAVNLSSSDAEFDTLGEKYGAKTHTLTAAQLPAHQHAIKTEYGTTNSLTVAPPGTYNFLTTRTGYPFQTAYTQADGGSGGSHNNIQPSIVKMSAIKYLKPENHNSELPVGSSIDGYWSISDIPDDYLYEDGSAVSCSTYSNLATVLGYSGCSTTFNLPDSRGRVSVNRSASDSEFDVIGEKNVVAGKTATLSTAQIPGHVHSIRAQYGTTLNLNVAVPGYYNQLTTRAYPYRSDYTQADGGSGGSHNNIQPSIVKVSVIKYSSTDSSATALPTGTSISGYWSSAPSASGYSLENTANNTVSRSIYTNLFNILGTTYGVGDGSTTFTLPNSAGRVTVNISPSDIEFDTMGELYGSKTHTLTTAQIPGHTHGIRAEYGTAANLNTAPPGYYNQLSNSAAFQSAYTQADGGSGGSHNNIQPSIVKNFAIKLTGGTTASGVNLLTDSAQSYGGSFFVLYKNLSTIFSSYGSRQYSISFDIKSSNANPVTAKVLLHDGPNYQSSNDSSYIFSPNAESSITVTSDFVRRSVTVTPLLLNASNSAILAFYSIDAVSSLTIKNVKVELGPQATNWTPAPGEVKALVVGGGASGGGSANSSGGGGGGGAGGLLYTTTLQLNAQAPYAVKVGSGGASVSGAVRGNGGGESSFAGLVAYGGGGGGAGSGTLHTGLSTSAGWSGSGGGAGYNGYALSTPGYGTSGQGYNGGQNGATSYAGGGGGGGAGGVGGTGRTSHCGGLPGVGRSIDISGSSVTYATGGYGGGCVTITSGAANTGDGGGAVYGNTTTTSGAGGSGIVIISYPTGSMMATGGDITYSGGYTIHTFRSSGTFTVQSIAN